MKRFLLRLLIFIAVIAACDFAAGLAGNYLLTHAKGGDTQRKSYIADGTTEDVLVFGSSRAMYHYVPQIMEDTLGLSVYNCGFSGNGIVCAYGFYRMTAERYSPRVLVYDFWPNFDLFIDDDRRYLGELQPFYDRRGISDIFLDVKVSEMLKMQSRAYRFNSAWPQMIMDNLKPQHDNSKGYKAMERVLTREPEELDIPAISSISGRKMKYLERLILDCKGRTQLIFAVSPLYRNTSDNVLAPLRELCARHNVPLLDHFTDSAFNSRMDAFSDGGHLSRAGSEEYSRVIAGEIKRLIRQSGIPSFPTAQPAKE